ncbi:DUF748 domain-containing protein [bacterium SCSIO 12643]|nr:DUF748 domain-containing protein [bacterium SCSIO 12643]
MKFKKVLLWFLGILILALGIGLGYLYFNAQQIAQNIIRNKIIKSYNESPETKYLLSLESIKLNLMDGSIRLINIDATPKDNLVTFERNLDGKTIANTSINVHIDEIALLGFDYMKALNERNISIDEFEINQPIIDVYQYEGVPDENTAQQDTIDLRSIFLTNYDTFRIKEIHLGDMRMTFYKLNEQFDTLNQIKLEQIDYRITNVTANKKTLYSSYYFEFEDYFIHTGNVIADIKNNPHLSLKSVDYDSEKEHLTIEDFELKPRVTPTAFWRGRKYKKAWLQLNVNKIQMDSLNIKDWLANEEIDISNLKVEKPKLLVFTNSTLEFHPNDNKPMLGDIIKSLPIPIHVDEADITDAHIELDIIGKNTTQHGKLMFHNMNIMAYNVTNIPQKIDQNKNLDILVNTKLNNTGNIHSKLKIDLASKESTTKFDVNAKNLDLKKFTSILKPILRISILDGKMVSLKINSTLDIHGGQGQMDAHYRDLKLQLESKELSKNPGFFNKVVSDLANGILKTQNIPGDKFYHQGNFEFTKSKHDAFFKMLWLTTLYGLEDSVFGSESRDQRRIKQEQRKKKNKDKWWKSAIL